MGEFNIKLLFRLLRNQRMYS